MLASLSMFGVELLRPWALLGVPLALGLLALAFRPERPREVVLGTLRWFGTGVEGTRGARGSRRSLPTFALLAGLALCCVSLAASGPRWGSSQPPTEWRVILDPRSSMALEHTSGDTRMQVGVERARALLEAEAGAGDVVRWILPDGSEELLEPDEVPGPERLGLRPGFQLRFADCDRPETLLVTDVLDREPPVDIEAGSAGGTSGGWIAVGAEPVPGLIGVESGRWLEWDGSQVRTTDRAVEQRVVVLDERLEGELVSLVRAWADARDLGVVSAVADQRVALRFEYTASEQPARSVVVGRDGWTAQFEGAPLSMTDRRQLAWLSRTPKTGQAAGNVETWVSSEVGRVRLGFTELVTFAGADDIQLALSFARLLDGATAPPVGAFSIADRTRTGAASQRRPKRAVRPAAEVENDRALAAWLAGLGAVLALAAWSLYVPGSGASGSD